MSNHHLQYLLLYTSLITQLHLHALHHNTATATTTTSDQCGNLQIPFPFHLNNNNNNTSTPPFSNAFSLTCINATSLYFTIPPLSHKILEFLPDAVLLDFPNTSSSSSPCRPYNDLSSFTFTNNSYFAISCNNILDLYGCEDSSFCKSGCEKTVVSPGCQNVSSYPSCCYPLSGGWSVSEGFGGFLKFGCRGFSSWVVLNGRGVRGVELEWAVPRNLTVDMSCAANADVVNASSVAFGVRCVCRGGFVGDGFARGVGCLKSCFRHGKEVHGKDCYPKKHGGRKTIILAGVIATGLIVVCLMVFLFLWKRRSIRTEKFVSYSSDIPSPALSPETCKPRLFSYQELEEATKGFSDARKISEGAMTKTYHGILAEGLQVAVQRIQCESESDCTRVIFRVEALSLIINNNMARILGWSIVSGYTPLVVYESPENATLEQHLHRARNQNTPLDWWKRLNIAAETASVLAFLHHKNSPPIFHNDLRSGCIFLDANFSVKLAGFDPECKESCRSSDTFEGKNDICRLGSILLEIITGKTVSKPSVLQKIESGKLEEIVDPSLDYHEQPNFCKEQIEIVADIATRCLLFGADGKLGSGDVAKELVEIARESVDGSSRIRVPDETFSNSSLLQMVSISPDSSFVP